MRRVPQSVALVSLFGVCLSLNITAPKCGGKQKVDTLLDVSRDFIKKAKSLYPNCVDDEFNCGKKEQSLAFLDVAMNVITQVKKEYPVCPDPDCPEQPVDRPKDCTEIFRSGVNESGIYTIWPRSHEAPKKSLDVYCDMNTDGGGWTVIQRRGNFSTPTDYFYKDWSDYKKGFGDIAEEFWIGNDNIFTISNQAKYSIRFDLKDANGTTGYAVYNTFWIEDEAANYTLHIDGYSGNVGDSMMLNDKMKFSTRDRDNDLWKHESCAVEHRGAWWYEECTYVNLNGLYIPGGLSQRATTWYHWKKEHIGLAGIEIKLRS